MAFDKLKGCLWGCALGDAIGMPYEFSYGEKSYNDIILNEGPFFGEISDDTEMMIVLATSLIKNKGLNESNLVKDYCKWVNSNLPDVGINTQKLFKNGFDKYKDVWKSLNILGQEDKWSQGNGCLMRSMPLCIFSDAELWKNECSITNPHPDAVEAHFIYLTILRCLLEGKMIKLDVNMTNSFIVKKVIMDVLLDGRKFNRDISINRGWVMNSLYCALYTYNNLNYLEKLKDPFAELMRIIIRDNLDSDTDTNAAISGAVLGMYMGFDKLISYDITKKNYDIVLKSAENTNRPKKYRATKIDDICISLYGLN